MAGEVAPGKRSLRKSGCQRIACYLLRACGQLLLSPGALCSWPAPARACFASGLWRHPLCRTSPVQHCCPPCIRSGLSNLHNTLFKALPSAESAWMTESLSLSFMLVACSSEGVLCTCSLEASDLAEISFAALLHSLQHGMLTQMSTIVFKPLALCACSRENGLCLCALFDCICFGSSLCCCGTGLPALTFGLSDVQAISGKSLSVTVTPITHTKSYASPTTVRPCNSQAICLSHILEAYLCTFLCMCPTSMTSAQQAE